jgi:hypothetical protein
MASGPDLFAIGQIAAKYRVPIHQIGYIIRTRNISHVAFLGTARVFNADQVAEIGNALREIKARKLTSAAC